MRRLAALAVVWPVILLMACSETRDLGSTVSHGLLPVDERNPIVLANDGVTDNWQGEYAMLLANSGGAPLAGIIVNASGPWPDIATNIAGWHMLVDAARASGLRDIPNPIASSGPPLVVPADGQVASTAPNRSEGAHLILDTSARLSLPYRPLVVVTGGRLTDLADAYLMDPTVTERVVVVASMGSTTASGGAMGPPNGEMDPWADFIVTGHYRFVQVSAFYDQTADVPSSEVPNLPANPFGAWVAAKQPNVWNLPQAADQVAVLAVRLSTFAIAVERVSPTGAVVGGATAGPELTADLNGPDWLVTQVSGDVAGAAFRKLLTDPATYAGP